MDLQFNTEEQGIVNAERALGELRALLNQGGTPDSSRARSSKLNDRDFALRAQLDNLDDMLQMITDARFARTLVENGQAGGIMGDNGSIDMLRFIVMTARDVLATETYYFRDFQGLKWDDEVLTSSDEESDPLEYADDTNGFAGPSSVDHPLIVRYAVHPRGQAPQSIFQSDKAFGLGPKIKVEQTVPPSPLSQFSDIADPEPPEFKFPTCIVCSEVLVTVTARLEAPCGHFYCAECTLNLVRTFTQQVAPASPLHCCPSPQQPIAARLVHRFIDDALRASLEEKLSEAETPLGERIYCPQENCRQFINPNRLTEAARNVGVVVCPSAGCRISICLGCKELTHAGIDCQTRADDVQARTLQAQFGWGRCPRCRFVVERISGCDSMSCRCGSGFSYVARN